jgi:hypothetical protein
VTAICASIAGDIPKARRITLFIEVKAEAIFYRIWLHFAGDAIG